MAGRRIRREAVRLACQVFLSGIMRWERDDSTHRMGIDGLCAQSSKPV